MRFGAKLHKLMQDRRLGDREAAKLVRVGSGTTFGRWRKGEGQPGLSEARAIAEFFGVPLSYLADDSLDDVPPPDGVGPDERLILDLVRDLNLTTREALRRLASAPAAAGHGVVARPLDPATGRELPAPGRAPRKGRTG